MTMQIHLPNIQLRPYQVDIWNQIVNKGCKKAFIVWHRRAGKDLVSLQILFTKAFTDIGNYWYILPQQNQVRKAIWEGITGRGLDSESHGVRYLDTLPKELIFARNNSEMKLILKDPRDLNKPGSIISFLGGDNYDALVGSGIKGCVISELALQKPNLYDLAIEPMLNETKGFVLFNSTPRGDGYAKDMFDFLSKKEQYYTQLLTIEDTNVLDKSVIDEERERGKLEEVIQQEYYCSWEGSILGSYYSDSLRRAKFGEYPYDPRHPVYTMWDLGVDDSTAIWFVQFIEGAIRLIDYYENHSFGLGHYANIVLNRGYDLYSAHYLPHDGRHRQLTTDEQAQSIESQLIKLGLDNIRIVPRTTDLIADKQAVRSVIPMCQFNTKTLDGFRALKQYRREYDANRQKFKDTPLHDWTSHGADAFRILPYIENQINYKKHNRNSVSWGGITKW